MGYTTDFYGEFGFSRPLKPVEKDFLNKLASTRRVKRDVKKLFEIYKGNDGNPFASCPEEIYGHEGEYFVGNDNTSCASIVNYNCAPGENSYGDAILNPDKNRLGQPGLWLQWVPNEDGDCLEWDECEKFYAYIEWLEYLINHFFSKWGVMLNGIVDWDGEDREDFGKIVVINNSIFILEGKETYTISTDDLKELEKYKVFELPEHPKEIGE